MFDNDDNDECRRHDDRHRITIKRQEANTTSST